MNDKLITKEDFLNLKEMPKEVIQFEIKNPFTNYEMDLIANGHKAAEMEDKWNFYMEGNKVYLHRSWTGICCYILEFYDDNKKILITANNKKNEQDFYNYDGSEAFYKEIAEHIYQIIKNRIYYENTEDKSTGIVF